MKSFPLKSSRGLLTALIVALQLGCLCPTMQAAEDAPTPEPTPWARRYTEGEAIHYHMRTTLRTRGEKHLSTIDIDGVVKKDPAGKFYEELAWNNYTVNEKPVALSPAAQAFRQQLTLPLIAEPADFMKIVMAINSLGRLDPVLLPPVADLSTFYVDLMLLSHLGAQAKAGDHRFISMGGQANSWADGVRLVIAEDAVDFDCTVQQIDQAAKTANLLIKHVPPAKFSIKSPADWMRTKVADTENNWVEVKKNDNGTYTASVGKETFDVEIKVSLTDGKILSVVMSNPIEALERVCPDSSLANPGEPVRYQLHRLVEIN